MTKEQEIYKHMRHRGRIFKSHGKWGIRYSALYCAIKDAGYSDDNTIHAIIDNMVNKGYIRKTYNTKDFKYMGNFIILKWVN
jgi:hypothetical protein